MVWQGSQSGRQCHTRPPRFTLTAPMENKIAVRWIVGRFKNPKVLWNILSIVPKVAHIGYKPLKKIWSQNSNGKPWHMPRPFLTWFSLISSSEIRICFYWVNQSSYGLNSIKIRFYRSENGGIETKNKLKHAEGAELWEFSICPYMAIDAQLPK